MDRCQGVCKSTHAVFSLSLFFFHRKIVIKEERDEEKREIKRARLRELLREREREERRARDVDSYERITRHSRCRLKACKPR